MNRKYVRDLVERVGSTFVEGAAGAVLVRLAPDMLGLPTLIPHSVQGWAVLGYAAAAGGAAAVLSLVKGLAARRVADPASASLVDLQG